MFIPAAAPRIIARPKLDMPGEHWGVEYLPGVVMHLGLTGLRNDSLEEFAHGRRWRVVRTATWEEQGAVLLRAADAQRWPPRYHITKCNCEIFANWLLGQPAESPQVNGWAMVGIVAAVVLAAP